MKENLPKIDSLNVFEEWVGIQWKQFTKEALAKLGNHNPSTSELEEHWWMGREQWRFSTGIYTPFLPFIEQHANYSELNIPRDTFVHLSLANPMLLCYTNNYDMGRQDRQIRTSVGRYIRRYNPDMHSHVIASFVAMFTGKNPVKSFKLTQNPAKALDVYLKGPHSCMSYDFRDEPEEGADESYWMTQHPIEAYFLPGNGISLAYLQDENGNYTARSLVCESEEGKYYIRVYGDGALQHMLERDGYELGNLIGCKLAAIPACRGWDGTEVRRTWIFPYIDNCSSRSHRVDMANDYSHFLISDSDAAPPYGYDITGGSHPVTGSYTDELIWEGDRFTCGCCEMEYRGSYNYGYSDHNGYDVCNDCVDQGHMIPRVLVGLSTHDNRPMYDLIYREDCGSMTPETQDFLHARTRWVLTDNNIPATIGLVTVTSDEGYAFALPQFTVPALDRNLDPYPVGEVVPVLQRDGNIVWELPFLRRATLVQTLLQDKDDYVIWYDLEELTHTTFGFAKTAQHSFVVSHETQPLLLSLMDILNLSKMDCDLALTYSKTFCVLPFSTEAMLRLLERVRTMMINEQEEIEKCMPQLQKFA